MMRSVVMSDNDGRVQLLFYSQLEDLYYDVRSVERTPKALRFVVGCFIHIFPLV